MSPQKDYTSIELITVVFLNNMNNIFIEIKQIASMYKNLQQVDYGRLLVQDKVDIDVGSLLGKSLHEVGQHSFLPNLPQNKLSGHKWRQVIQMCSDTRCTDVVRIKLVSNVLFIK